MSFNFKNSQLTFQDQDLNLTSKIYGIYYTTATATYTAITAPNTQTQTFTLKGLRVQSGSGGAGAIEPGDMVFVQPIGAALAAGVAVAQAWISAANTVSVTLFAGITNTPGAIIFGVFIVKMGQLDGINS